MNKGRRPLTEEEKAECARLKAIFKMRKKQAAASGLNLTQDNLGAACGWQSGQSVISQFFNARMPLSIEALIKLGEALQFEPIEVSPRLFGGIKKISVLSVLSRMKEAGDTQQCAPVFSEEIRQGLKIVQWGSEAAIRIPSVLMTQMRLNVDDSLQITSVSDKEISMRPMRKQALEFSYSLDDLMSQCDMTAPMPALGFTPSSSLSPPESDQ